MHTKITKMLIVRSTVKKTENPRPHSGRCTINQRHLTAHEKPCRVAVAGEGNTTRQRRNYLSIVTWSKAWRASEHPRGSDDNRGPLSTKDEDRNWGARAFKVEQWWVAQHNKESQLASELVSKRCRFKNFVNSRTRRRLMSLPKLVWVWAKSDKSTPISILLPIQLVDPWWNRKIVWFHELKRDFNNHGHNIWFMDMI